MHPSRCRRVMGVMVRQSKLRAGHLEPRRLQQVEPWRRRRRQGRLAHWLKRLRLGLKRWRWWGRWQRRWWGQIHAIFTHVCRHCCRRRRSAVLSLNVSSQVGAGAEPGVTDATLMRPLSAVDPAVVHQAGAVLEGLAADGACMRPLLGVYSGVLPQMGRPVEGLAAVGAAVSRLLPVPPQVLT